jgi:hypothetical protein
VTREPVTREPVTREPVTREPVTREPVTREPVTRESLTREPADRLRDRYRKPMINAASCTRTRAHICRDIILQEDAARRQQAYRVLPSINTRGPPA